MLTAARESEMMPSIVCNAVHLSDDDARARLLSALPDGSMRSSLESGTAFCGEAWSAETSNDYWVVSDGSDAVCFTVAGLTEEQAHNARLLWDAIRSEHPEIELDTEGLVYIVREVTGGAVDARVDD
jgi:hypothetical protein